MSSRQDSDKAVKDVSRREFFKSGTSAVGAPIRELTQKPKEKRILTRNNSMSRRTFVKIAAGSAAVVGLAMAVTKAVPNALVDPNKQPKLNYKGKVTPADRIAAANARPKATVIAPTVVPAPGGTPDYFGTTPNYANSPLPAYTITTPGSSTAFTGFSVTNGGSGYTTPAVVISGGGGTGASASSRSRPTGSLRLSFSLVP